MRIVNMDKFVRSILILSLIITMLFNFNISKQNRELVRQLNSLQSVNTNIVDAYEETKQGYEEFKTKGVYNKLDEIKEQEQEINNKQQELEQKEKELQEWEADLEARHKEKEQLAKARHRDVASAFPTRGGITRGEVKEVLFEVTMYTNAEGWWAKDDPNYGMMANGEFTHKGAVAGPKNLPFGTKIVLDDTKEGFEYLLDADLTVKDRGGAIKQKTVDGKEVYCIDIYQEDLQTALSWGRQIVPGKIIVQ